MGTVNWSDLRQAAGDGGFTALPPGEYDVFANSATSGTTSTGKDRIRVTFKVENGPHSGQVVVNDFNITPDSSAAMGIFFRQMTVLGCDEAYFRANPTASTAKIASDIQSQRSRCRLRTSIRQWQGEDRTNVDQILPPQPGTSAQAPPPPTPHTAPAHPNVPHTPHVTPTPSAATGIKALELPDDLPF